MYDAQEQYKKLEEERRELISKPHSVIVAMNSILEITLIICHTNMRTVMLQTL